MYKARFNVIMFGFLLLGKLSLWASGMGHYRLNTLGELEKNISKCWLATQGEGLRLRWTYPFKAKEKRPLTAVATTLAKPDQVVVTTGEEIFLSQDGGETFTWVAHRKAISYSSYFTSVAVSETNPDEWVVGTSFSGFHITRDAGRSWQTIPVTLKELCFGGPYYDTINDMVYALSEADKVYFAHGPYGKIASLNTKTGYIEPITAVPAKEGIVSLSIEKVCADEQLSAETQSAAWVLRNNEWIAHGVLPIALPPHFSETRRKKVQDKRSLYLTAWTASNLQAVRKHFAFIKAHGMNAVVIDFKDDFGDIMYDAKVKMACEAKAIRPILNIKEIRRLADELDIYLIARLVLFKDKKLHQHANNRYALWDKKRNAPWGHFIKNSEGQLVQREYWVDPFSPEVWEYNLEVAKELQGLGIDEVQFDYIRLPSDGPIDTMTARHNRHEMQAVDALESFLKRAREVLTLPISVNVFGYNGWFLTNALGQNIQRLSLYVDAISPMTYPSHYHSAFLGANAYLKRAHMLYQIGSDRAMFYTKGHALIRQYVQAFLLGREERNFSKAMYWSYLKEQIAGVYSSKGSGFLLWNASNNYYMVKQDVSYAPLVA